MKIILLQDIQKLGKRGDVKEVSEGYARNFLLPRNLAKAATDETLRTLATEKTSAEKRAAQEKENFVKIARAAEKEKIIIKTKIGSGGKAFGAITVERIKKALSDRGIEIEKDWIILENPLKKTGEAVIKIKFPHGISSEIRIEVQPDL